jgi:hypothetical protein
MSTHRSRQRGVALAVIAISLTVILGFCVLAVELGHLGVSAGEVQIVADGAAASATRSLLLNRVDAGNRSAATAGTRVAGENTVDGASAAVALTQGLYSLTTGTFTPGAASPNAVRAVATATVPSVLGGILGQRTTQIQRTAIAAYGGACAARTPLPLALGSCLFSRYQRRQNCGRLPNLQDVPDPLNDSCWTSLEANAVNASQASAYLPSQCCSGRNCGGGQSAPRLRTGSQINGLSGQDDLLLRIIKDCYDQGVREFVVPVINCTSITNNSNNACNRSQVIGFATIRVNSVTTFGNGRGMDVIAVCSTDDPGSAIGCSNFGRQSVALVK